MKANAHVIGITPNGIRIMLDNRLGNSDDFRNWVLKHMLKVTA